MSAKIKGILFKSDMIRSLLNTKPDVWPAEPIGDGAWKYQTRRALNPQPPEGFNRFVLMPISGELSFANDNTNESWPSKRLDAVFKWMQCPYPVGTIVYAKETFRYSESNDCACYEPCNCRIGVPIYRATANMEREEKTDPPWKPSIFMPKVMARLWFKVIDVRVERVNKISEEDAKAEGIQPVGKKFWRNYMPMKCEHPTDSGFVSPTESYQTLWDSINGRDSFRQGPWVWCYTLKKITKPESL